MYKNKLRNYWIQKGDNSEYWGLRCSATSRHAASIGSHRRFGSSLSVPYSRVKQYLSLEYGTDNPFRNVVNYQSTLRNIPEERAHLHHDGSLNSKYFLSKYGKLTFWRRIFFLILARTVFKMWVIQKTNKVALWNKRHFEEKKNGDYTTCLKYSIRIFVE